MHTHIEKLYVRFESNFCSWIRTGKDHWQDKKYWRQKEKGNVCIFVFWQWLKLLHVYSDHQRDWWRWILFTFASASEPVKRHEKMEVLYSRASWLSAAYAEITDKTNIAKYVVKQAHFGSNTGVCRKCEHERRRGKPRVDFYKEENWKITQFLEQKMLSMIRWA